MHGGGPYINKALNGRGRESKFLKGLRCTDKDTMEVVIQVLCGSVNKGLTAEIESLGRRANHSVLLPWFHLDLGSPEFQGVLGML